MGTQFFMAGFIGEMVLRNRDKRERYYISETL
jgi:hypothetical protein